MSDESDVTVARIGAALTCLQLFTQGDLREDAEDFLKRQFAPPEPAPTVSRAPKQPDTLCTKIVPGRGSLKREDAIRCGREMGHAGPCNFADDPRQYAEPRM